MKKKKNQNCARKLSCIKRIAVKKVKSGQAYELVKNRVNDCLLRQEIRAAQPSPSQKASSYYALNV